MAPPEVEVSPPRDAFLSKALEKLGTMRLPASAIFLSTFVILLREGVEAVLILAALFALLIKSKRRDALPSLHARWMMALALGGITWLAAPYVGAIVPEGGMTLVTAALLLYVGFWMRGKEYAERWPTSLNRQLQEVLSTRMKWTFAMIPFVAVYREAVEVILFYQALWVEVAPAYVPMLGGVLSAAVALTILGWLIFRGSIRLPLRHFFSATSCVMAALGVMFVGKGIAAF